jgi:hypothetical protein
MQYEGFGICMSSLGVWLQLMADSRPGSVAAVHVHAWLLCMHGPVSAVMGTESSGYSICHVNTIEQ